MNDDPWVRDHSPIGAERLHALGYINFVWNVTEYWFFALLASVSGLSEDVCRVFVYDQGDVTIADRIKAFAKRRHDLTVEEQAAVARAVEVYNVCRLNRNLYNHYGLVAGKTGLELHKVAKKPDYISHPIPMDLNALRAVGEEIAELRIFLEDLCLAIDFQVRGLHAPSLDTLPVPRNRATPPQQAQRAP